MPKSSYREENLMETIKEILPGFLKIAAVIAVLGLVFYGISTVLKNNDPDFVYQAPQTPFEAVRDFNPSTGNPNAEVVVMIVEDPQCPNCAVYSDITESVKKDYTETVKFVTKFMPLENIHPLARDGSRALYAANLQGKFTEYATLLFDEQEKISLNQLDVWAGQVGLNTEQFKTDRTSVKVDRQVTTDMNDLNAIRLPTDAENAVPATPGVEAGRLRGTPSTVIFVKNGDTFTVFDWWSGAQTQEVLKGRIDAALQSITPKKDSPVDGEFTVPVPSTDAQ